MSPLRFLRGRLHDFRAWQSRRRVLASTVPEKLEVALDDWSRSLSDTTGYYLDCQRYFSFLLPERLRNHRQYFVQNRRGFGEDAFHVLWFFLFRRFQPREFLEIGVYRGQTLSLAGLLQQHFDCPGTVVGISPFEAVGDSVSRYRSGVDYEVDTRANYARFSSKEPVLLKAYSTDAAAVQLIREKQWDSIYIDGNHDYSIAKADWETCSQAVRLGGVIVLDDSSLEIAYEPPAFASAGHPGPSRVAAEIDTKSFREILRVGHNRVFQKVN